MTPSFLDSAVSSRFLALDFLGSTMASLILIVIGLHPDMPHPHVDPDFRENAVRIAVGAAVGKYISFIWALLPGLTLLYPVLGVGRVHTVVEETLAAIRVQRTYRYFKELSRSRDRSLNWHRQRQKSVALLPVTRRNRWGGRDRSNTSLELRVVEAFRKPNHTCGGSWHQGWRALGMAGYVLSMGLCCRIYGESNDERDEERMNALKRMSDHESLMPPGKAVADFYKRKREEKQWALQKQWALHYEDKLVAWKQRAKELH